jgi:hypothetical protein
MEAGPQRAMSAQLVGLSDKKLQRAPDVTLIPLKQIVGPDGLQLCLYKAAFCGRYRHGELFCRTYHPPTGQFAWYEVRS